MAVQIELPKAHGAHLCRTDFWSPPNQNNFCRRKTTNFVTSLPLLPKTLLRRGCAIHVSRPPGSRTATAAATQHGVHHTLKIALIINSPPPNPPSDASVQYPTLPLNLRGKNPGAARSHPESIAKYPQFRFSILGPTPNLPSVRSSFSQRHIPNYQLVPPRPGAAYCRFFPR